MSKARQFRLAAETLADTDGVADAYVTLCVHAGIAAADVICCAKLGEHHHGEDHSGAIALLTSADRSAVKHLKTLLRMKTRSGHSPDLTSGTDRKRAGRAMTALVAAAEAVD